MSGEYACRSPRLYSLHWICRKLARSLEFAIERIPRERNLEANDLANIAARGGSAAGNIVENPQPFSLETANDFGSHQTL
jgi:hypothetical protein